jgi:hypothetical protein
VLTAVRAKTNHPVFMAAYVLDPIFISKETDEEGGMWSPPQLTMQQAVRAHSQNQLLRPRIVFGSISRSNSAAWFRFLVFWLVAYCFVLRPK